MQRSVNANPNRPHFQTIDFRDLLVFHALVAGKHDELALIVAKGHQRSSQPHVIPARFKRLCRITSEIWRVERLVSNKLKGGTGFEIISPRIPGDSKEPRFDTCAVEIRRPILEHAN